MNESSTLSCRAFSPLEINFAPPRRLRWLLVGLHGAALQALLLSRLEWFVLVVCITAVAVSLLLICRELRATDSSEWIEGLRWDLDRQWLMLFTGDGREVSVDALLFTAVVPGLSVMKLQRADRALPSWLVLAADQMMQDEWRRLRLVLQFAPRVQREASGQG